MMKYLKLTMLAGAATLAATAFIVTANSQTPPFGNPEDTAYAAKLWQAINEANLAGENAINTLPYEGTEPHGFVLETLFSSATIDGHKGDLIVKRNYGPADVEVEAVQMDRAKHLGAVTVMFRREAGFDADNKNWFWAKFLPDGSLDKNPKGMELAGRVAKGADKGCIACHTNAPGEDMVFISDGF